MTGVIAGNTTLRFADLWFSMWSDRRGLVRFAVVLAIFFALVCTAAWSIHIPIYFGALAGGIAAAVGALLLLGAFRVQRLLARMRDEQRDIAIEVDNAGVVTRDRTGAAVTVPWSVVRRARETRRAFVLMTTPSGHRYIAKRAFGADAVVAVRALIAEKLGANAKLRQP